MYLFVILALTALFVIVFRSLFLPFQFHMEPTGKRNAGYIYFITEFGFFLPAIKIGLTVDVDKRMKTFKTGTPFLIIKLLIIPTSHKYELEEFFHRKYKKTRNNGEWFWLTPKLIFDIVCLKVSLLLDKDMFRKYL